MKRLLLTVACWLAFCVAPGETQRSFHADIPPIVGNEEPRTDDGRPFGMVGMSGPCAVAK